MPAFATLPRLLRTVRHLRPGQLAHRVRLEARRRWWERRGPLVQARYAERARSLDGTRFDHPGLARLASLRLGRASAGDRLAVARDAVEGRFVFLNRRRDLGRSVAWHDPDLERGTRLWKTHLHEFPYAVDLAYASRETADPVYRERLLELVRGWLAASPIGRRGFALESWNARAVATRALNLAVAGHLLALRAEEDDGRFLSHLLGVHVLFLRDNLERDLAGNHLMRDAAGLAILHAIQGGAPDGLSLLRREVGSQVLPDGCHEERSPLYHAVVLQDLHEVRSVLGGDAPLWLEDAVGRMAGLLASWLPESGRLPLFGDSWLGEVDPRRLLDEIGGDPPRPAPGSAERHGGLVARHRGPLHLVVRAGPHAPDHQMGHAHADGLSFELAEDGCMLITDTGTATYDPGAVRAHLRSTRAHNTLALDGAEQLEAWGSFRVGRRGRARVVGFGEDAELCWLWAAHDAWRWLRGAPEHHRLFVLGERELLVLDAVTGAGTHRIESALHLHPDAPGRLEVAPITTDADGSAPRCEEAPLHERFGETRTMRVRILEREARLPWLGGWWIAPRGGRCPGLEVRDGAARTTLGGGRGARSLRWDPTRPGDGVRIDSGDTSRSG